MDEQQNQMNGQMYDGQQMYGSPQMGNQQMYGNPQMGGQQMYGNPQMGNQQMYGNPQKTSNVSGAVSTAIGGFTELFTSPADTINKLISGGSAVSGFLYVGVQALIAAIMVFITFLMMGSRAINVSAFGSAFYTLFFVIVMDVIIAGCLVLMCGVVFKGNMTFGKAISAVGIFGLFQSVATIICTIIVIIGGFADKKFFFSLAFILFVGITALSMVFGIYAALESCDLEPNIKLYTIGIALVAAILGGVVVDNICGKLFDESGTSAQNVYGRMSNTNYMREVSKDMHELYDEYYDDGDTSYREFLKDYYD